MRPFLALFFGLSGCWYLDDARFQREVQDFDGDGGIADRFGGPDCADHDPSIADCDADGDGFLTSAAGGDDCEDHDATVVPGTPFFADEDQDGVGAGDPVPGCGEPGPGLSVRDGDCDDGDAAVAPGAEERCDPVDRDCDGDPYAGAVDAAIAVYPDADQDGFGAGSTFLVCTPGAAESTLGGDCDDGDPGVFPGAPETPYDGFDQDCDPANEFDADADGDLRPEDGGGDCDDLDPLIFTGAPELCDGRDNDCDLRTDDEEADAEQAPGVQVLWHVDADGDGHGGPVEALFCPGVDPGAGYAVLDDDCNDGNDAVFPLADEWCNATDDDCDGTVDEGTAIDAFTAYLDQDGDGWGGQALTTCGLSFDVDGDGTPEALSLQGGDCSDVLADVHPGAPEVCGDAIRQDCSALDPDDCDGDGFLANDPVPGLADCADDPALGGADVAPDAPEICDGLDNDCDALVDSDDPDVEPVDDLTWYRDADGDGFGSPVIVATATCDQPPDTARNADDCDDLRVGVYPGAPELCNGADDDCDGAEDESAVNAPFFWYDADGDGSGDPTFAEQACTAPAPGWVATNDDCDDADGTRGPNLPELCDDGIDNDCDSLVDDADPDADLLAGQVWYLDGDGDGVGVAPGVASCGDPSGGGDVYVLADGDCDDLDPTEAAPALWFADLDADGHGGLLGVVFGCRPDPTWQASAGDCNDGNAAVRPGADEVCNATDDDCDGLADDGAIDAAAFFADVDRDGDGDPAVATFACFSVDPAWVPWGTDCDDADPLRSGRAVEVCGDGIDNDCDLVPEETDPDADPATADTWYADGDGDGVGGPGELLACGDPGPPWVLDPGDCDDADPLSTAPGVWFEDQDGDGFGGTSAVVFACRPGPTWFANAADCVDSNPAISPAAPEICNIADDDCDGLVDVDAAPGAPGSDPYWPDVDDDGYGDGSALPVYSCLDGPDGTTPNPDDCDDLDPAVSPGSGEIANNGVDDDCDPGTLDATGFGTCVGWQWPDADADGWGDTTALPAWDCAGLPGFVRVPADCNDDPLAGGAGDLPVATTAFDGGDLTLALGGGPCLAIALAPGFDATGSWGAPGAAFATVYSLDPTQRAVLRPSAAVPVFSAGAGGAVAFLLDVDILGTATSPVLQVSNGTAGLTAIQVAIDLMGSGSGIRVNSGTMRVFDVKVLNASSTLDGSALRVPSGAAISGVGLWVDQAFGNPSAIWLDAGTDPDLAEVSLTGSDPLGIGGGGSLDTVTLADLTIVGGPGDGLTANTDAQIAIDRALVYGNAGNGISHAVPVSGGFLTVGFATVVGNGGTGIFQTGMGSLAVDDSLALGNGVLDIDYNYIGGATLDRTFDGATGGNFVVTAPIPSPPDFVTFHPNLPADQWDLHLRVGSAGTGTAPAGEDAGAYSALDDWYKDVDGDLLPDGWELGWFGDLSRNGSELSDDADLADVGAEYAFGTSPVASDTDGDLSPDDSDADPLDLAVQ